MSDKRTMINDLTSGSVSKQLIRFSLPLLLSGVLQMVYNMVDMIVVGKFIGSTGQSAVSIGGDILNFLTFTAMGFSNAGSICISQLVGAGETSKVRRMIGTMFSFLFACAVVIGGACLILHNQVLDWLNTPAAARGYANSYVLTCIAGLIFIYGYNIVSAILRGMGDSKHPFVFIAIAAVLNLVLDLLFIAVFDMGVFGAALATVIGQSVSFITAVVYLYINRERFGFDFQLRSFAISMDSLKPLLKLGLPLTIQFAAVQLSMMVVNSWINAYGVITSAVSGIGAKLNSVVNVFTHALSSATAAIIGQSIGAKKFTRVKKCVGASFVINFAIVAVFVVIILLFPRGVFMIFNQEEEVLDLAMTYVPVAVVLFVSSALRCPMSALINGSGNSLLNLAVALIDGVIARIGLALLLGRTFDMGVLGYWYGNALAGIVPFFIGGIFFISGKWKKSKLIKE
ncbi:MAG: MATE family efflux transporter [Oscillospiraceae bacterium]